MSSTCLHADFDGVPYINGELKKKKRALKYLYKYFKCSLWPCLMYMWSSLHFSFKNFHFIFHFCFKTNWDFRDIHPKKI